MVPQAVAASSTQQRPTVLYIAGSGRSGSTLVERSLGAIPGFVNVGELIDLHRHVAVNDERCGCGEVFSTCPFWSSVGNRAFGGWTPGTVRELGDGQAQVARQRHLLQLAGPVRSRPFDRTLRSYRETHAALFRAVLEEAGARVVVDASKWPAQALALAGSEIDLRVLHLVRDVRGVAHSMDKRGVPRPQAGSGRQVMQSHSPVRAAARWTLTQIETDLLRFRGIPLCRLRYEDFVSDPVGSLSIALCSLGFALEREAFAHVDGRQVTLGPSHGLSGNPSRFRSGRVTLRLDDQWRHVLPLRERLLLDAIGLPDRALARLPSPRVPSDGDRTVPERTPAEPPRSTLGPVPAVMTPYASSVPGENDEWPLVSVVLPTRGRPDLVRETVDSIVAQDYPGTIEVLVIHDQEPRDPTIAEPASDSRHIRVLSNDFHTPGLAGARNTGLDEAKGELIATCDDDDLWHRGKLSAQVRLLRDEPDLLVVGSGIRLLLPDRIANWPGRAHRIELDTLLRNRVKELHSSTLVMRRDAFAKAGRYDETLPHGYAEDYEWVLRAARVGKIGVVIEPQADIRKNVQSWFRERAENTAEALHHLLEIHPELKTSRRGHARILGQIAYSEATLGQRGKALRTTAKALRRYPLAPYAYLSLAQVVTGVDPRLALKAARVFGRGVS